MIKKIKNNSYYFFIIIISFIFLLFIDENGPLYQFSNYSDVCIFYEIGKMIVHGCEMYVDFVDVKGPYMYFIGALSFIINKSFIAFFLFDLLSFILFAIFSFKIFKLYFNELKSFLYTILSLFISLYFLELMGNPETIFLGFFSLFLYWILSGGFNRNNKFIFVIFGIIFSFIFLTKLIYIIPFFIISLLYIYFNRKNLKKIIFEIGFFFIGIIIGFIPLFIYEPNVFNIFEIISRYLLIAKNYSLDKMIFIDRGLVLKVFIPIFLFLLSFLVVIFKFKKDNEKLLISLVFFIGFLLVLYLSKRYYVYYSYFFISFIPFFIIFIDILLYKIKVLRNLLILIVLILCLFDLFKMMYLKGFGLDINYDYQYLIYNDLKDEIDEDTLILNFANADNLFTKYFDFPQKYKYFNTTNLPYIGLEYVYEDIFEKVKNKEFDYISLLFDVKINKETQKEEKRTCIISTALYNEKEYLKRLIEELKKNYNLKEDYFIDYDYTRKNSWSISVFEKNKKESL